MKMSAKCVENVPQRICILGCSGAGKSTLARRLGRDLELPVVHSDQLFWRPGWTPSPMEEFEARMLAEVEKPAWIFDGNYAGTLGLRLRRAQLVIWLDYPGWLCLYRVLKRIWQSRGQVRPDMGPGCPERLDWSFLWFVLTFRHYERPKLVQALEGWQGRLIHLTRPPAAGFRLEV
ncbi:MAG: hypothetical protein AB7S38_35475 [Vulcanimicrobiota bacterium]